MNTLQRKQILRKNIPLLIMFMPIMAYYLIFKLIPLGGLVIAFKSYNLADGIWGSPWVGWRNFEYLFHNEQTVRVIRNTFTLSLLNIFVGFPVPLFLAIMLNEVRKMWYKKFVQTFVFLPHFLNWIIVGGIVITIFSLESSLINHWMDQWFHTTFPFLYNEASWIAIFVASGIWKNAGWSAIIYLAALSSIDPSLYEAANLDGANKGKQIWHITLPGIRPTIIILFILSMGQMMEVGFDHVYVLQNAVVSNVSEVISTWNYKVGLHGTQFSLATTMGFFESVVGFVFVLSVNWISRKHGEGLW
ncbi:sugar ABC transporter permease [Paenibacillus sp. N3.4]|uniref:ABC transporter permease n=1 Tax=Paenibacillus sp. N3.4 TaxID=2603222 RepID=UPI0011C6EB64|nr:ABC transporter permease subunit [Paenibacillus sp. N3.4]TXK84463.1 sugar ABC transporter permease [Paenibacillus sp. N3.4]